MAGDEDRQWVGDRAARLIEQAARLRRDLGRLAGRVAETEEQIAGVQEGRIVTDPERAAQHRQHARYARQIAAHERAEQRRLTGQGRVDQEPDQ